MTGRDIVKAIMGKVGISNAKLASRLGVAPNVMWDRINNKKVKDIPLSSLDELVRALDYKIMVVPNSVKCPDSGFVVEQPRRVDAPKKVAEIDTKNDSSTSPKPSTEEPNQPKSEPTAKPTVKPAPIYADFTEYYKHNFTRMLVNAIENDIKYTASTHEEISEWIDNFGDFGAIIVVWAAKKVVESNSDTPKEDFDNLLLEKLNQGCTTMNDLNKTEGGRITGSAYVAVKRVETNIKSDWENFKKNGQSVTSDDDDDELPF